MNCQPISIKRINQKQNQNEHCPDKQNLEECIIANIFIYNNHWRKIFRLKANPFIKDQLQKVVWTYIHGEKKETNNKNKQVNARAQAKLIM